MDLLLSHVYTFLGWLLQTTCQASLLICLVLFVQSALRRRIGVQACHFLWLLVLIRLALPWAPQTRLSLYNLLPEAPRKGYEAALGSEVALTPTFSAERDEIYAARPLPASGSVAYESTQDASAQGILLPVPGSGHAMLVFLVLVWLAGACTLGICILVGNVRMWYRLRYLPCVSNLHILDLLNQCQQQMGMHSPIRIIATDRVNGPALFGLIRPRLLLPCRVLKHMDRDELRYIFLHELAHLKRHDILMGAFASVLHILHWFNPLVTYAFQRMRADRELACDGLALSVLQPHETSAYGHTIIRLIEQLRLARPRPLLAGFLGDRVWARRRVAMISGFRKDTYQWSPWALLLVAVIGCVGLTNGHANHRPAHAQPATARSTEPHELPEAPATGHAYANTTRLHIRHIETGQYLIAGGESVDCDSEAGETGLWEARFDGDFGPQGDMLVYSVASGKFLMSDGEGNVGLSLIPLEEGTRWIRNAGPLGVQVISRDFNWRYLRLDREGRVGAPEWGRDLRSQWDIIQLERIGEFSGN